MMTSAPIIAEQLFIQDGNVHTKGPVIFISILLFGIKRGEIVAILHPLFN